MEEHTTQPKVSFDELARDVSDVQIEIVAPETPNSYRILTSSALIFISRLEQEFGERRKELLAWRSERQAALDDGDLPNFLEQTAGIRLDPTWQTAPTPPDLQERKVEITGPTDRKMVINALNSSASVFMADFEDANSPTWENMVEGQANLIDAIERTIDFTSPEGKRYRLNEKTAVLMVRPRGWHLTEKHIQINGREISASLFDFGLYFIHNAARLMEKGTAPYYYLPKIESHLEARLWNDVFNFAQDALGIPRGTIRATVLVETIMAAFEMEEILYELRDHSAGLNAGRWDYIFSIIKKFRSRPGFLLPDRSRLSMTVPFMRAYSELLVRTCHKRGAHAIGGMAAFIPSRKDAAVNETALQKVREDKLRESGDGFDGTWVAHPDLVPVALDIFNTALDGKPNQKDRLREEVNVSESQLIDFSIPGGRITEQGLRLNINVAILYIGSWLQGTGAAAIYNLMEDTATAEISRAQLWQWVHSPEARLEDGRDITPELYTSLAKEEMDVIREMVPEEVWNNGIYQRARGLLDRLVLDDGFTDFLTLMAYQEL
jgi:malate synthase